ncbi:MAG TPA: acyl-CoA dehydrogenase family protein [Candidatus Binatia bacterium]
MSPFLDQDHSSLQTQVREWGEKNLFPSSAEERQIDDEARRLVRQLGDDGFLAYAVPQEFGGARKKVQARDLCILREELARGSALADTMFAIQALGSYPITWWGTDEQKQRYLPPIAQGTAIAAFALTEPEAGSDISRLQTRAIRRAKEFCLTGTKRFISNAGIADHYVVFASTAPETKGRGTSAFVVDARTPGLIVKERTEVISPHPIGVIALDECIIPERSLLGNEGEGLKIALGTLDVLRCSVGAAAVGLAQRALEEAIDYGRKRKQFDRPLTEFQGTQFKLAEMATELEAARLLVYQAAWTHDSGVADAKLKSSMAKLFATEAAQRIVDQALQIHGGMGLVAGSIMERLYRDVRALRIYEGTSEIQKLVIARELLGIQRIDD